MAAVGPARVAFQGKDNNEIFNICNLEGIEGARI
jgi:hypothetical protein